MEKKSNMYETDWDLFTSTMLNTDLPEKMPKYVNEVQTIKALYNNNKIYLCSMWLDDLKKRKGSDKTINELNEVSTKLRTQGNEILKMGDTYNRLAAIKYTEAIFSSPVNSVNLALAHANRSVPLMNMEYYSEAYLDCETAKVNNYPSDKLTKILQRQVCCENHTNSNPYPIENRTNPDKLLHEKYSKKCGRFITAGENIKFGENIKTEKAFAFIPVYELSDRNDFRFDCQNCAKVNVFPFPCNICRIASYCSPQCKLDHERTHSVECAGYKFNLWYDIGIAHLAFRTFNLGFKDIWNKLNLLNLNFNSPDQVFEDIINIAQAEQKFQYGNVLNLVTNFDKMDENDILVYGLTAVMLTMYLKYHTSFFVKFDASLKPQDLEIIVASIIFRHLGQLVCNGHAIVELHSFHDLNSVGIWKKGQPAAGMLNEYFKSRRMFTAIYPNISMLNHSCDPNIANRFNNCDLTIFAARDINAKEEVFNCYGPNYRLMRKSERKSLLCQQYCFDCECKKCTTMDDVDDYEYYICHNKACRNSIYISDYNNRYWYVKGSLPDIVCSKCSVKQDYAWFLRLSLLLDKNCLHDFIEIFNLINKNLLYFSEFHELKETIFDQIINKLIPLVERINIIAIDTSLVQMIFDNIQLKKSKYGELSGEYLCACTFLLDYIAKKKINNLPVDLDYQSNLRYCTTVLSNQAKLCFDNYLNKYIHI